MKRVGNLWPRVIGFENLLLACHKARLGKRRRTEVSRFELNLEAELFGLKEELETFSYRPGGYRLFKIYERKPRMIAAAPFRDRVVHHALMNVLEPAIDPGFIYDSYACRQGKGVHAAVDRYQHWANRYAYALKLDIKSYFPSIDHAILESKLARRIKDPRVLDLLTLIIETSPAVDAPLVWYPGDDLFTPMERRSGLPIGNLTSQFLSNLYLDDLDHFVKDHLRWPAYLRYVDDMFLLGDDKAALKEVRHAIEAHLASDRLRIHANRAQIQHCSDGVDVLGYRVFRGFRRLRNENGYRFGRKLRGLAQAWAEGKIDWDKIDASVQSWIGHATHADTLGLRRCLFSKTIFRRGSGL